MDARNAESERRAAGARGGGAGSGLLWQPDEGWVRRAHISAFMADLEPAYSADGSGYERLWRWSVEELESFWAQIWQRFGVQASAPYQRVLASRRMPGAEWFPGARLNYAENLLARPSLRCLPDEPAILHCSELRSLESISRGELAARVHLIAGGLRQLGVARGDRVVAYLPNIPETLIAFLAAASIGAIFSSAAPELGARAVIDRFAQIEPSVLFTVDGYRYGGRDFDRRAAAVQIAGQLPGLKAVVALGYLERDAGAEAIATALKGAVAPPAGTPEGAVGAGRALQTHSWQQLEALGAGAEAHFEQLPFDHPLWVLYSSGTTGAPKAIVHGHGGMLLEQLKKSYLHLDLHRGDRIFWYTTTAWMMWNFLVGCLLTEATIVMYDGSPAISGPDTIWELAERTRMTTLGTSAGFLTAAMGAEGAAAEAGAADGVAPAGAVGGTGAAAAAGGLAAHGRLRSAGPADRFDLSALRAIGSTGSPLSEAGFEWVYRAFGDRIWLYSTSGGTDVCTAFLGGCPILPVYAGELQCRALGCDVAAFNEQGESVVEELGELVVRQPMPSMPLFFWGDEDARRYRESYFEMYPGIWRHGDWIRITERGSAVVYGRSDATINRGGVRIGSSEIYGALQALPQIADALVVDLPGKSLGATSRMILFVVLCAGAKLDQELEGQIKARIRQECSPRHVPDLQFEVSELPRTLSGKLLEVPVKRILMGVPAEQALNTGSLANPASVEQFVALAGELAQSG